jgi:electron transfer flavoprotein alpha subunit
MSEVLILGEVKEGSLDLKTIELLGAGKKLASELDGEYSLLLIGNSVSKVADEALSHGLARVYKMEHPLLEGFKPDLWLAALEQACGKISPKILLMSHSFVGMELGPRLSSRLNSRLTTDCIDLSIDPADGLLLRTKPVSGGNAISVFKFEGEPQLATVRGKVFAAAEPGDALGEIEEITPEIDESMIKVESLEIVEEESVALDKASVVVAGGAGKGQGSHPV